MKKLPDYIKEQLNEDAFDWVIDRTIGRAADHVKQSLSNLLTASVDALFALPAGACAATAYGTKKLYGWATDTDDEEDTTNAIIRSLDKKDKKQVKKGDNGKVILPPTNPGGAFFTDDSKKLEENKELRNALNKEFNENYLNTIKNSLSKMNNGAGKYVYVINANYITGNEKLMAIPMYALVFEIDKNNTTIKFLKSFWGINYETGTENNDNRDKLGNILGHFFSKNEDIHSIIGKENINQYKIVISKECSKSINPIKYFSDFNSVKVLK